MNLLSIALYQRRLANSVAERPEVATCLRADGHRVHEYDDGAAGDWRTADLIWLQGNAGWFPKTCRGLERTGAGRPHVVVWHTEPLPPRPGSGLHVSPPHLREIAKIILRDSRATDPRTNVRRIRQMARFGLPDLLVVSSRSREDYLRSQGIESHFVPIGYSADAHGKLLGLERDIDVLFLGTMQVRRRERLVSGLRKAKVALRVEGSWTDRAAWGDSRTRLLNRTKMLLNLQRNPGEFCGLRMILGMCNGALIVSEPVDRPEPYVPGRHYVEASAEEIPAVLRYYLEHPEERHKITEEAHRFVTETLTMRNSLNRILELALTCSIFAQRGWHFDYPSESCMFPC